LNTIRIDRGVVQVAGSIYFIQGAIGIASVTYPLYLRSKGFSIPEITFIASISSVPWFLKIFYGAISDGLPLWNLRRKPYLVICSLLGCLGWVLLGVVPSRTLWIIMTMMMANLGIAATDVITDGLVVEHSNEGTAQIYQSISWGARSVGAVLSGVIGGFLAAKFSAAFVFALTGFLPLLSIIFVLPLKEEPCYERRSVIDPLIKSFQRLCQGDLRWFIFFLVIAGLPSAFGTPFFFFMYEQLKFDEIFIGVLQSITWLGAIAGCFGYLKFFKNVNLKQALYWAVGIGFLQVLMVLAIRGPVSALVISIAGGVLGYVSLLPMMSSAAKLANGTKVESSLFAVLMSIYNISQSVSLFLGGVLFPYIGLVWLIILTAILGLAAFWVVPRLKSL
jgi:MFS family permease